MKMKLCPHCNGTKQDPNLHDLIVDAEGNSIDYESVPCYICEGTGEIPDQPVNHCQACGEPTELGIEWCDQHRPAADLWQALNKETIRPK